MMKRNRIYPTNNRNWTTIHIDLTTKRMLDDLSFYHESYDNTIRRLIKRRTFDIVNGEIVDISEYKKDGEVVDINEVKEDVEVLNV